MFDMLKRQRRPHLQVTLLSKPDCGLCDEAERAVRTVFGARHFRIVSILSNPTLEDEFVFRIPVLLFDDVVLAEGQIGEADARKALQKARMMVGSRRRRA